LLIASYSLRAGYKRIEEAKKNRDSGNDTLPVRSSNEAPVEFGVRLQEAEVEVFLLNISILRQSKAWYSSQASGAKGVYGSPVTTGRRGEERAYPDPLHPYVLLTYINM